MKRQMMLFRSLIAMVLFLILAQANIWVSTQAHLVLAVGYRALLVAAPSFMMLGTARGMRLSVLLGSISAGMFFFQMNSISLGIFALSMAVAGYIAKYVSSSTIQGAADNKIALNIGSLLSGAVLMVTQNKEIILVLTIFAMLICLYLSNKIDWDHILNIDNSSKDKSIQKSRKSLIKMIGWGLIGVATGIKLTGIFTILPQYLLHYYKNLPSWYGAMIIINSLGVILVQHRILKWLELKKQSVTLFLTLTTMFLLAIPEVMKVQNVIMATLWMVFLTFGECALSCYDRLAKNDGYLLAKEMMVGLGSFLTVTLSRQFQDQIYLSGLIGALAMIFGVVLVASPHLSFSLVRKVRI